MEFDSFDRITCIFGKESYALQMHPQRMQVDNDNMMLQAYIDTT